MSKVDDNKRLVNLQSLILFSLLKLWFQLPLLWRAFSFRSVLRCIVILWLVPHSKRNMRVRFLLFTFPGGKGKRQFLSALLFLVFKLERGGKKYAVNGGRNNRETINKNREALYDDGLLERRPPFSILFFPFFPPFACRIVQVQQISLKRSTFCRASRRPLCSSRALSLSQLLWCP